MQITITMDEREINGCAQMMRVLAESQKINEDVVKEALRNLAEKDISAKTTMSDGEETPVDPSTIFGQPDTRPLNAGVDVDLDGLPWDGRIHASSRAKLANGKWRTKRGVTDAQVATIQAELRQTWNSKPAAAPVLETATVTPVSPPPVPTGVDPFLTLMKGVTAGYANGSISAERIQDILAPLGIPSLPMLTQRPDLIPAVATAFGIAI